jgi:hypothetical protein
VYFASYDASTVIIIYFFFLVYGEKKKTNVYNIHVQNEYWPASLEPHTIKLFCQTKQKQKPSIYNNDEKLMAKSTLKVRTFMESNWV